MGYFRIPLDLPHAATISERIATLVHRALDETTAEADSITELTNDLFDLLWPYRASGENPPEPEASETREEAARLGRAIVQEIERLQIGGDRLGQCIRNLFECLELGEEGAEISLRAGENPNSLQRPL
ncbi:MAG TPA: hypothetical protein VLR94_03360 [Acidobacteriota bacterium]|nr:hypothetical protein [Acidobacteriota bacterium]